MPQPIARHVLYVEDDRINIILMEEAFRGLPGWTLHCVETGAQALAALPGLRPELVLIDLHLPDMNGIELFERMQADASLRDLRCVAVSADDPPPVVAAARAAGFADFWLKPIGAARLQAALLKAATQ